MTSEQPAPEAVPRSSPAGPPLQVVVMGVSGTGKTSVASAVAEASGYDFVEGDVHHPRANVEKMSAGIPLTDEDRKPWLETLGGLLAEHREQGRAAVLACSALKRSYRDILRGDAPVDATFFLHIDLPYDVLLDRMEKRDHFMPPSLLRSQFDTLQRLDDDEHGAVLDADEPLGDVVERAIAAVRAAGHTD